MTSSTKPYKAPRKKSGIRHPSGIASKDITNQWMRQNYGGPQIKGVFRTDTRPNDRAADLVALLVAPADADASALETYISAAAGEFSVEFQRCEHRDSDSAFYALRRDLAICSG